MYFDFNMIFVKKNKNDFWIAFKKDEEFFLMLSRSEELRKQDFLYKNVFHFNFKLVFSFIFLGKIYKIIQKVESN